MSESNPKRQRNTSTHLLVFKLHVMYRIYHPILKFYQMLRVVPRHNPIREIYHNPIRNSYRMIRTIPSVIPAYPTSVRVRVQTSTCKPVGSAAVRIPGTHKFQIFTPAEGVILRITRSEENVHGRSAGRRAKSTRTTSKQME